MLSVVCSDLPKSMDGGGGKSGEERSGGQILQVVDVPEIEELGELGWDRGRRSNDPVEHQIQIASDTLRKSCE